MREFDHEAARPPDPLTYARLVELYEMMSREYQPARTIVVSTPRHEGSLFDFINGGAREAAGCRVWELFGPPDPNSIAATTAAALDEHAEAAEAEERPKQSYEEWHAETVALLAEAEERHE
jgi:hypothetical protein